MKHYSDIITRLDKLNALSGTIPRFKVRLTTGENVVMFGNEIISPAAGNEIEAIEYDSAGPCSSLDLVRLAQALSNRPIEVTGVSD